MPATSAVFLSESIGAFSGAVFVAVTGIVVVMLASWAGLVS
jgi:hypothetical protein